MMNDLTSQQLQLENFMSDISERCYSAGWLQDLEYVLWDALINGPRKFGGGIITEKDIETLKKLSEAANAWIVFDDVKEETAMDLESWRKKFNGDVQQNPDLLHRING
jgi:hypothetical protein